MRKSMILIYVVLCGGFFLYHFRFESQKQAPLFVRELDRTSITFLMGDDKVSSDYFEKAEIHFSFHPEEKTDLVVKSLRSFEAIINYLNDYSPPDSPWGVVNIVLHGSPNTGLRTFITDGGHVATPKRLVQALLLNSTPAIKHGIADSNTNINIWGCGIGKNPLLNMSLSSIFKTENGDQPKVYCSPHFVLFKENTIGGIPERVKMSYWPYFYKRGYQPSDSEIVAAMKDQFPDVNMNWNQLASSKNASSKNVGDSASVHSYHVPAVYTKIYSTKNSRPDVGSTAQKEEWVKGQSSLMDQVEESGIPFDRFHWTVNKIIHTNERGQKVPAIKAIGMSTVMCFLKEI